MNFRSPLCVNHSLRSSRHAGFTLAEMILSVGISTVLIVCLTSSLSLVLSSVASPSNSPVLAHIRTGEMADRILSDLTIAQSFTLNTASDVEFKVPSRDGDATADTIRYQWTGTPSNQLLRSYNGGSLNLFAANVQEFGLSYLTRTMGPPPPSPPVESAEYIVMQHDDAPSGSLSEFNTSTSNWCAQWINPNLSPDAVSWKITRVEFRAKRDTGGSANFLIQIRTADPVTKMPTTTVLSTLTQATADLPITQTWIAVDIPDAPNLSPETGYCLVIAVTQSTSRYPKIQFESNGTPMPSRTHWMTSSNAGTSWSTPETTKDMRFKIHGTVTTQPL
jgi:Tfp pilus assembly protein FimT